MRSWIVAAIAPMILMAANGFIVVVRADDSSPSGCRDTDVVTYEPMSARSRQHISIERMAAEAALPAGMGKLPKEKSVQGTAWFYAERADFSKPGPWTTTVFVESNRARPVRLRLTFQDHGNEAVHAIWLNEKLLFIECWWGRFAASDAVIDVETGKIIYAEDAYYGQIGVPCAERARSH
jgi:hypothetical protein